MVVDMVGQQAAAQRDAKRLADQLAGLEAKLSTAVAREEFSVAESIKVEVADVRSAWVMAEAQARAIGDVLGQVAQQEAERAVRDAEEQRREQARAQVDRAIQAEREATAEYQRHTADIQPGLAAVRESLRAALACEAAIEFARRTAYEAMVTLGERGPGMRIYGPTSVSVKIEHDPVLHGILHGSMGG